MAEEPRSVPETFAFACGDCGHTWEAGFELMFFTDPLDASGLTTQEYVDEAGKAIRSPLADAVCPRCGGRTVHVGQAGPAEPGPAARHTHRPRPPHRSPERSE
ncbi:hypothetical protein HLK59_37860 [Streptomyces sp. S3(2020)]|uniref:hypothetical protein n=1 Tax=Streptomyces sp. S3(2020) TaxID=2732044 RepID=UPI001488C67C|nr:hypothetical protein [Streptomyces sp. S3(2020)]NNN36033.1 hypothetical protein [Streptomyces sp. S3(2020)]